MAPLGPIWPHLAPFGPVWLCSAPIGPFVPIPAHLAVFGPTRSCSAPFGPVQPHWTPFCPALPFFPQFELVQTCCTQVRPGFALLDPTWNLLTMANFCFTRPPLAPSGPVPPCPAPSGPVWPRPAPSGPVQPGSSRSQLDSFFIFNIINNISMIYVFVLVKSFSQELCKII